MPRLWTSALRHQPERRLIPKPASVIGGVLAVAVAVGLARPALASKPTRLAIVVARWGNVEPPVTQGLVVKLAVALSGSNVSVVPTRELGDLPAETDPFLVECLDDDTCLTALAESLKQPRLALIVVDGSGPDRAVRVALVEPPRVRRATKPLPEDAQRTAPEALRQVLEPWLAEAPPPKEVKTVKESKTAKGKTPGREALKVGEPAANSPPSRKPLGSGEKAAEPVD